MRYVFLLISFVLLSVYGYSQELVKDEVSIIYNNHIEFGGEILTTGFGLSFRRGKKITVDKRKFLDVNIKNYKHPKEIKTSGDPSGTGTLRSYVYGKLNSIHHLRLGYGREWTVAAKENKENVSVNYLLSGGLSLAFLKPYYLLVRKASDNVFQYYDYETFDPQLHGLGNIEERAPYRIGFGEMKVQPGVYLSSGLKFDYGNQFDMLRGIEAGISTDIYPQGIPILAERAEDIFLFNIYLRFTYGRKW